MPHNKPEQLNLLISLLDDERNDIYLHIDIKATLGYEAIEKIKNSGVYCIEHQSVSGVGKS